MEIRIVTPERSEDEISEALRGLTKRIYQSAGEIPMYGLGGEYGYGAEYDSELFAMHPYCWCERDACPWCSCCGCDEPCEDCAYHEAVVAAGGVARLGAPNFWHKPSGLRVWWYKWIGRDMEIMNPKGVDAVAVINECIAIR